MNANEMIPAVRKASGWLMLWSAVVFVCGILAVFLPLTFSFGMAVFIGSLAVIAGIAHFLFAFQGWSLSGFSWHMLLGGLYEFAAIYLLVNPLLSVVSLALILAVVLLLEGILEFALYFRLRQFHGSAWVLADGVATTILGVLMLTQWPPASLEKIGVVIGINLMLSAVSRLILLAAIRESENPKNVSSGPQRP
jgi:uncharacterized membrane protein HdeD (DUF308 family)